MSDIERMLDGRADVLPSPAEAKAMRIRLLAPLVLLAGVGAALALMPAGVKDALMTGRSVAQSADR